MDFNGIDVNTILDALTIVSVFFNLIFLLENFFIYFFAWDVTTLWIKMAFWRQPGFIRWTGEAWHFHLAYIDPLNPKKWICKMGGKDVPFEKIAGSVGIGPGKVALGLITDENNGGAMISLNALLAGRAIGATPAHVSSIEKAAYAEGYTEGFEKSNPKGMMEWAKDNLHVIIIVGMILIIGIIVGYDHIISSPAAWSAAQACETQKGILLNKLGQCGADVSSVIGITTTTTLKTIPYLPTTGGIAH